MAGAWPGLAVRIALLRVLREEPDDEREIETLPRRGYPFIGRAGQHQQSSAASDIPRCGASPTICRFG